MRPKCQTVIPGDHLLGPLKVVVGGEDYIGHLDYESIREASL